MRVAIVGSRKYALPDAVTQFIESMNRETEIVSGGARGVDTWAMDKAIRRGHPTKVFEADWLLDGQRAGLIRNSLIVDYVDYVVAFWDGSSTGTADTMRRAKHVGKLFRVYGPDGEIMDMG